MKNITKEEMNIKEFLKNILMWQLLCQVELIQYFWFIWQKNMQRALRRILSNLFFNRNLKKRMQKKFAVS